MIWLLLLILLIAVLGIGTVLEAALWILIVIAVVVIASIVLFSRLLSR